MEINKFVWDDSFSVEVAEMDEQHKHFFSIVNEIYDLILGGDVQREKLIFHVTDLGNYAAYHLSTEEALFNEFRVSFLEAVSNINGSPVGYASNITPTYFDFVNNSNDRATVNRIKELVNILSEAEKVFYSTPGKDIKMESIDPQSDDNNPMKVERAVSIFDLKEKINNLAGKDIH